MKKLVIAALLACSCDAVVDANLPELALSDRAAGKNPCDNPAIRKRINVHAQANDPHRFVGTNGDDVIFGTSGNDVIFGNGGDDIICAGDGDDYIDGGDGRDIIDAGAGDDIVHGRGGSDHIWGGPGADILFGDILDDHIFGEGGNDILIGGHGTDVLDGGDGNDFLRGDTGNDTFIGGDGVDTASFATAMPPGQVEVNDDGTANPITGVHVADVANGDGGNEPLHGIERFYGSSFVDRFDVPGKEVIQTTKPAYSVTAETAVAPSGRALDMGIVVLGGPGNDNIQIFGSDDNVKVVGPAQLTAGAGCEMIATGTIRCPIPAGAPFHYVVAYGDAGDDTIQFFGKFPRELEAHASGGTGNDHLIGGDEGDVLFTGPDGTDWLEGGDGDDALLSESHHIGPKWKNGDRPEVADYKDGADRLDGGPGNDQLVSDYVCGGHRYIGGPGFDIAGFARSGSHPIHAQLGKSTRAAHQTQWYGFAANMDLCGSKQAAWTSWKTGSDGDLEVLEASDGADYLWGSDQNDVIWGRGGGDHIWGWDGDDEILGADGDDVIDGGEGNDQIKYGAQ